VLSFLKDNFVPGSLRLLIFGLVAGLALMRAPGAWGRWGRRFLVALVLTYSLMSLPIVATSLAAPLERGWRPITAREAQGADALVVLGGGVASHWGSGQILELPGEITIRRLLEAARVYRLLDNPAVVVSGGIVADRQQRSEAAIMHDLLVELGVPSERIVVEGGSRNTREQAERLPKVLAHVAARRFVLVTSPAHMTRAAAAFRAQGLTPLPSVADCCGWQGMPGGFWMVLPSDAALRVSSGAFYEYVGLVYYWLRGWV